MIKVLRVFVLLSSKNNRADPCPSTESLQAPLPFEDPVVSGSSLSLLPRMIEQCMVGNPWFAGVCGTTLGAQPAAKAVETFSTTRVLISLGGGSTFF